MLVAETLPLIDEEAELPIVLGGSCRSESTLPVDRVYPRLLGPTGSRVGHPLRELSQLTELFVGVGADHWSRGFGFAMDQYSGRGCRYPFLLVDAEAEPIEGPDQLREAVLRLLAPAEFAVVVESKSAWSITPLTG